MKALASEEDQSPKSADRWLEIENCDILDLLFRPLLLLLASAGMLCALR